ncbi:response regulator [Bacteroides sp. 214]|uniref:ATP-binding response regulator n=1 Tax=Bacteroides sp. 214 TaxID=2302935 RepID=UPI0013D238BB|nr:ATP-binding protein [Bacteroides sp. 214]NDW13854.1 response regulator [Bacteroides sp. 214]
MSAPTRFTKIKLIAEYSFLFLALVYALYFIRHEMRSFSEVESELSLQTDSLMSLLKEKDENALQMLTTLNESDKVFMPLDVLENVIAEYDSIVDRLQYQRRVIAKQDSVITPTRRKGFFKRLANAFVPEEEAPTISVNKTIETTTDSAVQKKEAYEPLKRKIRAAANQDKETRLAALGIGNDKLLKQNSELSAQIDSLISRYEENVIIQAELQAESRQMVRQRIVTTIGVVAIVAILLSTILLIIILRDITRSNRYRKELEIANRRAEELLYAREKLMLTITHDFKAPLASIIGYVELLLQAPMDEKQKQYLENMNGSSTHLLKLVNDLLDFHRLDLNKEEMNNQPFNAKDLFDEINTSFAPLASAKSLVLNYEISEELNNSYLGDSLRIRQITTNLLSNAIKFTPEGSVSLAVSYENARISIRISDTGKGMTEEDQMRIFQEFTRLAGAQGEEGFGLGLSIVYKLVQLFNGTIDVASKEGEGSSFTVSFLLPLNETDIEEDVNKEPKQEEPVLLQKSLRVLMIDDDKLQLSLVASMLEKNHIKTVGCEDVEELIEQLRVGTYDVLLTDVQMPAINGLELFKLLRSSNIPQAKTIPVLAITARSNMSEQDFLEYGFAGCLMKPFSIKDLLTTLGKISFPDSVIHPSIETILPGGLDFSALTAFSADDKNASKAIIETFISETKKNINNLRQALSDKNVDMIASMAHKLLPTSTLIKAEKAILLLTELEAIRGESFNVTIEEKANVLIGEMEVILKEAEGLFSRPNVC